MPATISQCAYLFGATGLHIEGYDTLEEPGSFSMVEKDGKRYLVQSCPGHYLLMEWDGDSFVQGSGVRVEK